MTNITIPTLNIDELVAPPLTEINIQKNKTDKINIFNPFTNYSKLNAIRHAKDEIAKRYEAILSDCYSKIASPVEGPGMVMSFAQVWSLSKGLSATMRLQSSWNELNAMIDRKYTYSTAILSFYIAVLAIVLTVFFGFCSISSPAEPPTPKYNSQKNVTKKIQITICSFSSSANFCFDRIIRNKYKNMKNLLTNKSTGCGNRTSDFGRSVRITAI